MAGPESRIRNRYRKEAERRGWFVMVLHGSAYSGPGRADTITLAPENRWGYLTAKPVAIEFKTETGAKRSKQFEFLRAWREVGGYGFFCRQATLALKAVECIQHGIRPYEEDDPEMETFDLDELDRLLGSASPEPPSVLAPEPANDLLDTVLNTVAARMALPQNEDGAVSPDPGFDEETRTAQAGMPPEPLRRSRKPRAVQPPPFVAGITRIEEPLPQSLLGGEVVTALERNTTMLARLVDLLEQLTFEVNGLRQEVAAHSDLVGAAR